MLSTKSHIENGYWKKFRLFGDGIDDQSMIP